MCKLFANNPSKEICIFLVFLNYSSGCLKFCKYFCIFEIAWLRDFQKCIFYHFLDIFNKTGFCQKKRFSKFANFFQILKVQQKSFPLHDVSFVIFGHQTWDKEGGGSNSPPSPAFPGFPVPKG